MNSTVRLICQWCKVPTLTVKKRKPEIFEKREHIVLLLSIPMSILILMLSYIICWRSLSPYDNWELAHLSLLTSNVSTLTAGKLKTESRFSEYPKIHRPKTMCWQKCQISPSPPLARIPKKAECLKYFY